MEEASVAIVGMGPRGVNVLERIAAYARTGRFARPLNVHIVEPGRPGPGVHAIDQPDYLLLNTVASQITMFLDSTVEDAGPLLPGPNLHAWAAVHSSWPDVTPNTYLPRRLFGEYLAWVYDYLVRHLRRYAQVSLHRCEAVDLEPADQRYKLHLADGSRIWVDYAFLTTGHPRNEPDSKDRERTKFVESCRGVNSRLRYVADPYPLPAKLDQVPADACVLVEGMGLTAVDIVAALTVGRGGGFRTNPETGDLLYAPSGHEPRIALISRSGLPLSARAENQKGTSGQYPVRHVTRRRIQDLRSGQRKLDFNDDVFPILWREMHQAFYVTLAKSQYGPDFAKLLDQSLTYMPPDTRAGLIRSWFGDDRAFRWDDLRNPVPESELASAERFRSWLLDYLERDLREALLGNQDSPLKAACDVLRDARDAVRDAIDFAGLTPESHADFLSAVVPVMNRLAVGPPKERVAEFLALFRNGYIEMGLGPSPRLDLDSRQGAFVARSTSFDAPPAVADVLVRAQIPKNAPARDNSPLIQNLLRRGLVRPFYNGAREIGGIEVNRQFSPVCRDGVALPRVFALGTIAEGVKFYTYIVPRPHVNSTALVDADRVVAHMVADLAGASHDRSADVPESFAS